MPPRNVVPKPVQKPHPPLWVACSRRDTILLAAEKGIGALSFAFVEPEDARQWVDDYESRAGRPLRAGGAVGQPPGGLRHPDDVRPRRGGCPGPRARGGQLLRVLAGPLLRLRRPRPGPTDVWQEFLERRGTMGYSPEAALAARHETLGAKAAAGDHTGLRGAIGTPDQLRQFLRRYEAAGVDQLIFVMQAGHNRHEDIMESIELFGSEVLPEFVERDEAASRAKAARLEPVVEAALARALDRTDPSCPRLRDAGHPQADGRRPGQRAGPAVARGPGRQAGGRGRRRGVPTPGGRMTDRLPAPGPPGARTAGARITL